MIALVNLAAAAWAFLQLRPRALETLRAEIAEGADQPFVAGPRREWADAGVGGRDQAHPAAPMATSGHGPAGSRPALAAATPETVLPTWSERPTFAEAGLIGWFTSRINDRPMRADRSRALHGEGPGRLDRLDLWFLIVIVAATLGLRIFRLAEPYQMHFDEVYHARTASEFLQAWRYGYSHDIYEWTHPHFAKYAMAGGIVAWGDNRVSATSDLGVPVADAIVEVRRDDPAVPGGRAGDRVHVVTGSELRSYDLESRRPVFEHARPGRGRPRDRPAE